MKIDSLSFFVPDAARACRISGAIQYNKGMFVHKSVLGGRTVHIVPREGGGWQVVDLLGRVSGFPSRMLAEDQAKRTAAATPPSQVVLFDQLGNVVPIAHYQLPAYPPPPPGGENSSLFEAAVKSLVIAGLVAAGAKVLGDLVERVNTELEKETAKATRSRKRTRRSA